MIKVEKTEVDLVDEIEVLGFVEKGVSRSKVAFSYGNEVYVAMVKIEGDELDVLYEIARKLRAGNYEHASEEDLDILEASVRNKEREHEFGVKDIVGFLCEDRLYEFWVVKWHSKGGKEAYYAVRVNKDDMSGSDFNDVIGRSYEGMRGEDLIRGIRAALNSGDRDFCAKCGDTEVSKAKSNGTVGRFDDPVKAGFRVTRSSVCRWFRDLVARQCAIEVLGRFGVLRW